MSKQVLAKYHLDIQVREIAEMKARTEPFQTHLAGVDFTVFPNVYPGGIDSELVCGALSKLAGKALAGKTVLDLCTGTGIVALKAALLGANKVIAVDLNPEAVKNAAFNATRLALSHVEVREGFLFEPIGDKTFDVISINPPYTGKKPADKTEICFWDDNNATTRRFFAEYKKHLNSGGIALFAWADFGSLELIKRLAKENDIKLELVASRRTDSGLATFLVYRLADAET